MSKETFYFSHDYNARSDDKIKRLIRAHGMSGYGIFWSIVEDLYNNANALRTDYEGIAYDLRVNSEIVKSIINDFELFCFENGSFGSTSVERRLDERNSKSEKARQSAFKRWDKNKLDANAMQTHSKGNAPKVKLSKVKEYIYSDFYDYQLQVASEYLEKEPATKIDTEAYGKFVRWIFNKDEFLQTDILGHSVDNRKRNLLNMPKQLSFVEFGRLKQKYNGSLLGIFEDMENWKDLKKRKEIYKTALTFINNRTK